MSRTLLPVDGFSTPAPGEELEIPQPAAVGVQGLMRTATQCPVLIIEDDADLREMMAQLLTLEGFHPLTAANGREALDYLSHSERPGVILLDLMMPVMDGWEFRREQQRTPAIASVPVVVLSALDQSRAVGMDATAFLKKPLDFDQLLQILRDHCH